MDPSSPPTAPTDKPSSTSPPMAAALPHVLPSNQNAVAAAANTSGSSLPSPVTAAPQAVDSGPGPIRHPRPITAAELHEQMEKEQEAVVNRLTRELSILRAAHNASVASNTSSTMSAQEIPPPPPADSHLLSGPMFMTPSKRHNRSSSNASSRSTTAAIAGSTISTPAPPGTRPPHLPISMSRQSSTASTRQSSYSHLASPGPQSYVDPSFAYFQRERLQAAGGFGPGSSVAAAPGGASTTVSTPVGIPTDLSRLEETTFYRTELDAARRENEALKAKIRQLEKMVRDRRASDASITSASQSVRSMAGSTQPPAVPSPGLQHPGLASLPIHLREKDRLMSTPSVAGSVGVGVPEEELKVGESAASIGLGAQSEAEPSLTSQP